MKENRKKESVDIETDATFCIAFGTTIDTAYANINTARRVDIHNASTNRDICVGRDANIHSYVTSSIHADLNIRLDISSADSDAVVRCDAYVCVTARFEVDDWREDVLSVACHVQ